MIIFHISGNVGGVFFGGALEFNVRPIVLGGQILGCQDVCGLKKGDLRGPSRKAILNSSGFVLRNCRVGTWYGRG